jgi:hypothetical protein
MFALIGRLSIEKRDGGDARAWRLDSARIFGTRGAISATSAGAAAVQGVRVQVLGS